MASDECSVRGQWGKLSYDFFVGILRAQMLRELPASLDDKTFLTREVLNKLGPRIVRTSST